MQPSPGPASNSTLLGAAAEHYVMCQLLRRQMIAALAPTGVPDADIIVSDRFGSALAAVQVKARRDIGRDRGWHMKAKHEKTARDLLFYCLVDFGRDLTDQPQCWILPSPIVADTLMQSHKRWLVAPGRNGRPHQDHEMRRFLPDYSHIGLNTHGPGWLDPYKENWRVIAGHGATGLGLMPA